MAGNNPEDKVPPGPEDTLAWVCRDALSIRGNRHRRDGHKLATRMVKIPQHCLGAGRQTFEIRRGERHRLGKDIGSALGLNRNHRVRVHPFGQRRGQALRRHRCNQQAPRHRAIPALNRIGRNLERPTWQLRGIRNGGG